MRLAVREFKDDHYAAVFSPSCLARTLLICARVTVLSSLRDPMINEIFWREISSAVNDLDAAAAILLRSLSSVLSSFILRLPVLRSSKHLILLYKKICYALNLFPSTKLIESFVTTHKNPIQSESYQKINFSFQLTKLLRHRPSPPSQLSVLVPCGACAAQPCKRLTCANACRLDLGP